MFCKNNDDFFKYQIDVDWKFDKPAKRIQRHPTKSETRKIERKPKWTAALTHVTGGNIRDENELASYFATNPEHIGKKRLQFFCHTEGARFVTIWRAFFFGGLLTAAVPFAHISFWVKFPYRYLSEEGHTISYCCIYVYTGILHTQVGWYIT